MPCSRGKLDIKLFWTQICSLGRYIFEVKVDSLLFKSLPSHVLKVKKHNKSCAEVKYI